MIIDFNKYQVWLVTGSQHLYGDAILQNVETHSKEIAEGLSVNAQIPVQVRFHSVVTDSDQILSVCRPANAAPEGIGVIVW